MQIAMRQIYFKDKDLDKSKYKPSELDQLEAYVKNYMEDDPKNLNEEEKQKLIDEAKRLALEQLKADKAASP